MSVKHYYDPPQIISFTAIPVASAILTGKHQLLVDYACGKHWENYNYRTPHIKKNRKERNYFLKVILTSM